MDSLFQRVGNHKEKAMILLIGSTGYIGSAFANELNNRGLKWVAISHADAVDFISRSAGVELVCNCAAFIPKPSVALCDKYQHETIEGNLLFPMRLALACSVNGVPIAHISTGCLWSDGEEHSENDEPQRSFVGHCGFYIGIKVMAEQQVRSYEKHYIWRVRLPFDEASSDRNYLTKLATMPEVWDHENTICHRGDFAKACLDLYLCGAEYGTFNVMNPGSIKATDIVARLIKAGIRKDNPKITSGGQGGAKVSVKKLLDAGVKIRSAEEAVSESITEWVG